MRWHQGRLSNTSKDQQLLLSCSCIHQIENGIFQARNLTSLTLIEWKLRKSKDWAVSFSFHHFFIITCHVRSPRVIPPVLRCSSLLRLQMHYNAHVLGSTDCDGETGQLPDETSRHISQWHAGAPVSIWLHLNCAQRSSVHNETNGIAPADDALHTVSWKIFIISDIPPARTAHIG